MVEKSRSFMLGNLEIHEDGKVYRLNKNGKHEAKPIVTNIKGNDRVVITYMKDGSQKHTYLSREIAKRFVPNENNYNIVSFKDGDTTNVSADNLIWISKAEQVAHAVKKRKAGQTLQAIGDKKGVSRERIRQILKKIEKGTPQFKTKAEREQMDSRKQEEM